MFLNVFGFFSFLGTRVIQVFASDADGIGPSGQVKYSIVSKHNKFKIDPNTGWLTTNAVRTCSKISLNYFKF
jgi:hypothetical protein